MGIFDFLKVGQIKAENEELKQNHINAIYESANSDVCPRCGGKLVLRTAKKGPNIGNQFYGCSKFPKCRGIRQI